MTWTGIRHAQVLQPALHHSFPEGLKRWVEYDEFCSGSYTYGNVS